MILFKFTPKRIANNSRRKSKCTTQDIAKKANNAEPIRVLYKKAGQVPRVKIIDNTYKLKKAIITKNLDIIPYETVYIICNNMKNQDKTSTPNIVLDFYNIVGDLILVDIDKDKRELKGLSLEDVIWYTQDLINKSFNGENIAPKISKKSTNKSNDIHMLYGHDLDNDYTTTSSSFEKSLIGVLMSIELLLEELIKK